MYKGTSAKKKDGMHRPEGAGNFDNMDDFNVVNSINTNEIILNGVNIEEIFLKLDTSNDPLTDGLSILRTTVGTGLQIENTAGSADVRLKNSNGVEWSFASSASNDSFSVVELGVAEQFLIKQGGTASFADNEIQDAILDSFTNRVEADQVHIQVRNESGSAMSRGDLVFISGYNLGLDRVLVSLADADGSGTFPAIGILDEAAENNADAHCTVQGRFIDIDTDAFSVGDSVYMTTTPGVLGVRPTGDNDEVQAIGIVLRSNANNGVLEITGAGRTNDVPNGLASGPDTLSVKLTLENPTSTEDFTIAHFPAAVTITEVVAVVVGSSTPSVTIEPQHNTDRSAAGNNVLSSATAITSTTTGQTLTSFDDATLPANSYLWLETTAQSGTVLELHITITYTED